MVYVHSELLDHFRTVDWAPYCLGNIFKQTVISPGGSNQGHMGYSTVICILVYTMWYPVSATIHNYTERHKVQNLNTRYKKDAIIPLHYFFKRSMRTLRYMPHHIMTDIHERNGASPVRVYFLMAETAEGYGSGRGIPNGFTYRKQTFFMYTLVMCLCIVNVENQHRQLVQVTDC